MGTLFRSQEMTLCQLFLQTEAAYACVSELGELGLVQFRDLNPDVNAFQRKFVNEIRRCDEMERKLRYLEKEIKKDTIPMLDTGDNPEAPAPREMIDLEATFEKLENELREVNSNAEQLKRNFLELTELKHILRKTQSFFDEDTTSLETLADGLDRSFTSLVDKENVALTIDSNRPDPVQLRSQSRPIQFVAGVLLRERIAAFELMLWRACRGNVFLKQAEIETPLEDPVTGDNVFKSVFIIFFQGDQLKTRVKKICEAFRATLYPCPDSQAERREMAIGVMTRIEDLNTVLNQTQEHRHRVLVAAAKNIKIWFLKVRKIKAIYHTLNMFNLDVTNKCLIGECWCAVDDLDKIHLALRRGTERSGSSVQPILNRMSTKEPPPTYNRVNKFTTAFQAIVDAYGVSAYREANPAPFTCITFPFLFAVMFGDAGHGTIMFLFGLWMVLKEKKFASMKSLHNNETASIFFGGRYIILLMGLFSIYTGLIYNDVFSKSLNLFGSSWYPGEYSNSTIRHAKVLQLNPNVSSVYSGSPYPFGLDPAWQLAKNKITFTNSVKMKMSIILGVTHMLFGVTLSLSNHLYFNDSVSVFVEFIPQVLFLSCIFGYLIILIFYKWIAFTANEAACAPSLLIGLINMFLMKYDTSPDAPCAGKPFFSGQVGLQIFLLVIAVLCVPVMLLGKPLILRQRAKARSGRVVGGGNLSVNSGDIRRDGATNQDEEAALMVGSTVGSDDHQHEDEEFDFADTMVNQSIHTIEYCLGCISNTASYLRLWALSLAHAQLSEVLWNMILHMGLSIGSYVGAVMLVFTFAFWAVLTMTVLLLMEGLSAFLHALRLHWVEFQNKFYKGSGYKFEPFSFEKFLEITDE